MLCFPLNNLIAQCDQSDLRCSFGLTVTEFPFCWPRGGRVGSVRLLLCILIRLLSVQIAASAQRAATDWLTLTLFSLLGRHMSCSRAATAKFTAGHVLCVVTKRFTMAQTCQCNHFYFTVIHNIGLIYLKERSHCCMNMNYLTMARKDKPRTVVIIFHTVLLLTTCGADVHHKEN